MPFLDTMIPKGGNLMMGEKCVVKEFCLPTGYKIVQHKHKYPHGSALVVGTVRLSVEGQPSQVLHAPVGVTLAAHVAHHIEALTDVVWLCIHPDNDEAKWIEP